MIHLDSAHDVWNCILNRSTGNRHRITSTNTVPRSNAIATLSLPTQVSKPRLASWAADLCSRSLNPILHQRITTCGSQIRVKYALPSHQVLYRRRQSVQLVVSSSCHIRAWKRCYVIHSTLAASSSVVLPIVLSVSSLLFSDERASLKGLPRTC